MASPVSIVFFFFSFPLPASYCVLFVCAVRHAFTAEAVVTMFHLIYAFLFPFAFLGLVIICFKRVSCTFYLMADGSVLVVDAQLPLAL